VRTSHNSISVACLSVSQLTAEVCNTCMHSSQSTNQLIKAHFLLYVTSESEAHSNGNSGLYRLSYYSRCRRCQRSSVFKSRLKVLNSSAERQLCDSEFQTEGALTLKAGVLLTAAVCGGQWGRWPHLHWGTWIPDDVMHDWVNGVIWYQLCNATLWIQLLCNPSTLQPVSLGGPQGAEFSQRAWPQPWPPLRTASDAISNHSARIYDRMSPTLKSITLGQNMGRKGLTDISQVLTRSGGVDTGLSHMQKKSCHYQYARTWQTNIQTTER